MPAVELVHDNVADPEPLVMVEDDRVHERVVELVATARVTVPEKPLKGATVTVELPARLVLPVTLVGLAETVKSGEDDCTTATLTVVE